MPNCMQGRLGHGPHSQHAIFAPSDLQFSYKNLQKSESEHKPKTNQLKFSVIERRVGSASCSPNKL